MSDLIIVVTVFIVGVLGVLVFTGIIYGIMGYWLNHREWR